MVSPDSILANFTHRTGMEDLSRALTYQIKQDIATRYFGFRKQIETDSGQYLESLQNADKEHGTCITDELLRMRCLLRKEELFHSFLEFTKLPEAIGYCPTDRRGIGQWEVLFTGLKGKGMTRRRRYRNLVYQVYEALSRNVAAYLEVFLRLQEEHEDICRQIKQFYRKNDLVGILNFLRELDNPDGARLELLQPDGAIPAGRSMEQELRITPPPAVTSHMHDLARLPPLQEAKPILDELIGQAYPLFDYFEMERLPF
jgi:hypothetical protein